MNRRTFLYTFNKSDLAFALSYFIREIKKLNGQEYPPNTLKEIVVMLQMYLHENGLYWKLLEDQEFLGMRNVLDNTMKERTAQGLGVTISSSVISLDQESQLFDRGILGEDNPEKLVYTVIYMMGLHLALWGGVKHTRLRHPGFDSQISIEIDDKQREHLVYKADPLQKNNQGGIGCFNSTKTVYVYKASNTLRCPVCLFKKYVKLLLNGKSCKKLYLHPKVKPTPSVWFCDQPLGNNKVTTAVKTICKKAGFVGKFTNHSLRATSASKVIPVPYS